MVWFDEENFKNIETGIQSVSPAGIELTEFWLLPDAGIKEGMCHHTQPIFF